MPDVAVAIFVPLRIALVSLQRQPGRLDAVVVEDRGAVVRSGRDGAVDERQERVVHDLARGDGRFVVCGIVRSGGVDLYMHTY